MEGDCDWEWDCSCEWERASMSASAWASASPVWLEVLLVVVVERRFDPGFEEEDCPSDFRGETLRLVVLLRCEPSLPLTFDVLAIPCRQERMRSEGATWEDAAEVLPSRKLRWLAFVAIEAPAIELVRLEVPGLLLPKTEPRSQSSTLLFDQAQSCRKILILPV